MNPVWIILLVAILSPVPLTAAETHVGKVVKIADGDTLTLLTDGHQIKYDSPKLTLPRGGNHSESKPSRHSPEWCSANK